MATVSIALATWNGARFLRDQLASYECQTILPTELVISDDGEGVDGILSERDIVAALARHGEDLLSRSVSAIMTRTVVTCDPSDTVGGLMAEMTNRRIRHFPVVADGRLCGIVSIGDLVKSRLDEVEFEAESLRSLITGA